jgi:hypothetical protein
LQAGEKSAFDFGGDVRVDLLHLVFERVPEACGLSDLGDAVGNHPRLVTVPEAVEGRPGLDRLYPHRRRCALEVAVGGGGA